MKRIEVVAAIIRKGDKIFATQRGHGEWKDWWEFPGGKMESGETRGEALVREIREELDTDITIDKFLHTVEWDYPDFHLTMYCFMCSLKTEALHLNEHEAAKWLNKDDIHSVNWLPADEVLLPLIVTELESEEKQKIKGTDIFAIIVVGVIAWLLGSLLISFGYKCLDTDIGLMFFIWGIGLILAPIILGIVKIYHPEEEYKSSQVLRGIAGGIAMNALIKEINKSQKKQ